MASASYGPFKRVFIPVFLFLILLNPNFVQANRGASLFKLCSKCHGDQGEGNKSLAAPAISGLPDWYVLGQLNKFKEGIRGKHASDIAGMRMRAMGRTLNKEGDVEAVAAFVSNLARTNASPTLAGDAVAGEQNFAVCMACHGADAKGNKDLGAPPLKGSSDWYLLTQLKHFKTGIRGADPVKDALGATMAPMAQMLDDQSMLNVLAYIQTL